MTAQPIAAPTQQATHLQVPDPIPQFEGNDVAATRVKVSGLSQVDVGKDVVISTDDRVRMVGEFRVVGVRHYVDEKTGDIYREQVVKPIRMELCPFDPSDPTDDGIVRNRPRP